MKLYLSRSSAIRAAREAARKALGPYYEAAEGPDYIISPRHVGPEQWGNGFRDARSFAAMLDDGDRWSFELRGPAANPTDIDKDNAAASWARYKEKR